MVHEFSDVLDSFGLLLHRNRAILDLNISYGFSIDKINIQVVCSFGRKPTVLAVTLSSPLGIILTLSLQIRLLNAIREMLLQPAAYKSI